MDKAIERINCMDHLGKPESTGWKNVLTLLPSTRCGNAAVFNAFKAKGLRTPVSSAFMGE